MIHSLAGIFIFLSLIFTMTTYFIDKNYAILSGAFAWIALMMLFMGIKKKLLLYILMALTFAFFLFSYHKGFAIDFQRALLVNQHLLVLLIGVGFLRLIATPKAEKVRKLPEGKRSFLKTYLGIHLFGSVINLTSLILVADKLYKKSPLSKIQIVLLTRAFSSDAYWSPFFVAFAAALTYAPKLNAPIILVNGLFLATVAFVITYAEVHKSKILHFKEFRGYPIHFETLYIPVLLAILVLVIHHYFPSLKVIILIALFSLLLTIAILPMKSGLKKAIKQFNKHITTELPNMKGELALFLIAGAFGVSISSILLGYNFELPFDNFTAFHASIMLLLFIVLSFVGIHPIISIAVVGNWMHQVDHTLLAAAFLMSWATAVSTSPFSGLNLTIQARYDIKPREIFQLNIIYATLMYLVGSAILYVIDYSLSKI